MAVSFTDEDAHAMAEKGYAAEPSELGDVYYPAEKVTLLETAAVNYVEYPWITCFEVDGVEIKETKTS